MIFSEWWKKMKPAECDEVKPYFEEAWQTAFCDGYEKGVAAFHEAVKLERDELIAALLALRGDFLGDGFVVINRKDLIAALTNTGETK